MFTCCLSCSIYYFVHLKQYDQCFLISLFGGHNVLADQCAATAFLPVCHTVCLPMLCPPVQYPMILEKMSYFQTYLASLPSFHFFHSFPKPASLLGRLYLGQRCAVNGVLTRLWTEHTTPIDILPTPFQNIYFQCDFFSPLVPFLCLTSLPSLNQYGWLDNFTRSFMPKGTPERETQLLAPLLNPSLGPLRRLFKLRSLRWFSQSN